MELINFLLVLLTVYTGTTGSPECENGWMHYKNDLCIKTFTNFLVYHEAKMFCSNQGNEVSKATLVTVKDEEMQDFLASYTQHSNDYLWLGGKYDPYAAQFRWEDGELISYTNWQEGYPRNVTQEDACIELRPSNAKSAINTEGKWADVQCQKRNLVMCQRKTSWTLQQAVEEIIRMQRQHQQDVTHVTAAFENAANERNYLQEEIQKTRENLQATQRDLQQARQDTEMVSQRVVPVGSTYIEYYGQPSPLSLWPYFHWQEITRDYAGLFFRAYGDDSGGWGSIQSGCAPRITTLHRIWRTSGEYPVGNLNIPADGWSEYGDDGTHFQSGSKIYDGIRFYTEGCEVRPKNQAIRIWRRFG